MTDFKKTKTILCRLTQAQYDKLLKLIGKRTISQWLRDRIERAQ